MASVRGYVLVGGWPGSGKTTLARALADELGIDYLAKDEVKEALMDQLGAPGSVEESQRIGRAAVAAVLRAAQGCRAAVIEQHLVSLHRHDGVRAAWALCRGALPSTPRGGPAPIRRAPAGRPAPR
ncbi:MAG: AAA family ATPase [Propioniciclava sp.]|uniref:AAA family ATPase n=1 Tax=Propioniciclava sp. TaxID=2038686 RepID=UPI0039E51E79